MKTKHLSRKQILLYLLKEIPHEKEKSIKDHLKNCKVCQKELAREKKMIQMVTRIPRLDPDPKLIKRYRLLLKSELMKKSIPRVKKYFWVDMWKLLFYSVPAKRFASAVAILFIGFILGLLVPRFNTSSELTPGNAVLALRSSMPGSPSR